MGEVPKWEEWKILLGFFIRCWESEEEWIWPFLLILKLKTAFCRYLHGILMTYTRSYQNMFKSYLYEKILPQRSHRKYFSCVSVPKVCCNASDFCVWSATVKCEHNSFSQKAVKFISKNNNEMKNLTRNAWWW